MPIRIATSENKARFHHYAPVMELPEFEWIGTLEAPFDEKSLRGIDAFICSCEYHLPTRLAIAACKRFGIPSFHLIDGIVEWRNLFENPRSSHPDRGAPLFRPLMSDHTFAMGETQRWALQWLGNTSVHATGLPRLDGIAPKPCRVGVTTEKPRLLIATANTPWFDAAQERKFKREFGTLVTNIKRQNDNQLCLWRVAPEVADHFGLANQERQSVVEALSQADALITTPSSLAVEAMLLGVPTLVFDPYARPCLNPAAWSATSGSSALDQLPSLLMPDPERAALQDSLRDLSTATDQAATQRIAEILHRAVKRKGLSAKLTETNQPVFSHRASRTTWPANLTITELQGLAITIPSLERKLHECRAELQQLCQERENPSLRQALGFLFRMMSSRLNRRRPHV